jgi:hypothetical protein
VSVESGRFRRWRSSGEGKDLKQYVRSGAPLPLFFVSVAAKGVSPAVSRFFATLAGRFISVAAKGLTGVGWEDFGGV